jgi:protein tyrosine/serine phosphatase
VHCHAGKDRSGTVVALALTLAGVPADAVAADYALLNDRVRADFAEQLALVEDPTERAQLAESFTAHPRTMLAVLNHLGQTHGSVETYLRQGGLDGEQISSLRRRLVG